MIAILVIAGLIIGLFVGSFLSKRRFGLLGLGLTAGAILSPIWGNAAGYIVSSTGLVPEGPLVTAIAASLIIVTPAILFMFHGYTYKYIVGRVIGSFFFTVLAVALLVTPIGSALTLSGPVANVYDWFVSNRELIISATVVFAVADLLTARAVHKTERKRR